MFVSSELIGNKEVDPASELRIKDLMTNTVPGTPDPKMF